MTDVQIIHQALRGLMGTHGDPCRSKPCQAISDGNGAMSALHRIATLSTLRPASEWTEADGPVLWWAKYEGGDTQFLGAGWPPFLPTCTHWSPIPKVELPGEAKR